MTFSSQSNDIYFFYSETTWNDMNLHEREETEVRFF